MLYNPELHLTFHWHHCRDFRKIRFFEEADFIYMQQKWNKNCGNLWRILFKGGAGLKRLDFTLNDCFLGFWLNYMFTEGKVDSQSKPTGCNP